MKLKDHQKRCVEKFENIRGLILYHSLGSGKTITSIACAENKASANFDKLVILPASLIDNFAKELNAYKANVSKYKIYSYEKFYKLDNNICENKIVIVDEAHRLRNAYNGSKTMHKILTMIKQARSLLFLTGTPVINHPSDISPLVNSIFLSNVFPTKRKEFENLFYDYKLKKNKRNVKLFGIKLYEKQLLYKEIDAKNIELFKYYTHNIVDYHNNFNINNFPTSEHITLKIPMSNLQEKLHTKAAKENLTKNELNMIKYGYNVDLESKNETVSRLNRFLNKTRQITNYVAGENTSPKFEKVIQLVKQNKLPALIYSNFKNAGVLQLEKMLTKENYKCKVFSGSETQSEKKKIINDYNNKKLDVLLITASGAEGIDLKNTQMVIVLEPHWNYSRIKQAIGRAIRYKSHSDLNKSMRHVKVYHLLSVYKPNKYAFISDKYRISSDVYLKDLTSKKQVIIDKFMQFLV